MVESAPFDAYLKALRSFKPFHGVVDSPILAEAIDLEIFPSADGLYVSLIKLAPAASSGRRQATAKATSRAIRAAVPAAAIATGPHLGR